MTRRLLAVVLAFFAASAGPPVPAATPSHDPFPTVPEIHDNVEFWKRVFAEWHVGQVAVHDADHPAVVYEVVELPGPVVETYTREQRDFLSDVRDAWRDRLEALAGRVRSGAALDPADKELVLLISTRAGTDATGDAHRRVRTQRGLRERFLAGLERSSIWDARIRDVLRENGLPEDLACLPHVESSFQPHARSSAGAVGLWQLTRDAARRHGLEVGYSVDERLDPVVATEGAAKYLADAFARLGSWPLAVTSYNHGVGGMTRAREQFGDDFGRIYAEYRGRWFGFASKNFYAEFLAVREIAAEPHRWFPEGYGVRPAFEADEVRLPHPSTPRLIAETYGLDRDRLAQANPAWTGNAVRNDLALPENTRVWLPAGTLLELAREGGDRPVPPRVAASATGGTHVVRRGDTLSRIAALHGVSLASMRRVNAISGRGDLIRVGQRLRVPGSVTGTSVVHRVRRGESLSGIAADFGTTVGELRGMNGIPAHSNLIRAGQRLRVPGGASRSATTHVVVRGDTLSAIASAHGLEVADLRRANGLRSDVIRAGQVLHLGAAAAPPTHVVRRGDTLGRIAARYGVALVDLLTANQLTVRSIIRPGQSLQIPL